MCSTTGRIEAGRIEVARAPFVLPEMLDGVLAIVRPRAIESGVHLTLDCMAPHDAHRLGDAGKIQQVLLNLVGNAMKFSPRGRVTVNVRRAHGRDGRLRFEVVDDGTGVDEAALPRLFEPFTQIHPHTTDRGQGAGLGLAISRALVTGMGGEIGAERRRERGSRFWFELDLPPAAAPARCEVAPPPDIGRQSARTILMVEDDEVNRVVGKALLERRGHRVLVAATGMAAIRMARDHRVDVVLMDIRLPDIDGFEAARRIRTLYGETLQRSQPPIIALTAQVEPSDATACEAAGIDDLVVKPFSPEDLCRRIELLPGGGTSQSAAASTGEDAGGLARSAHTRRSLQRPRPRAYRADTESLRDEHRAGAGGSRQPRRRRREARGPRSSAGRLGGSPGLAEAALPRRRSRTCGAQRRP